MDPNRNKALCHIISQQLSDFLSHVQYQGSLHYMYSLENVTLPKYLRKDDIFMLDESRFIELKSFENTSNIQKYILQIAPKYICAFLNSEGGYLLLGINDDGKIIGLQLDHHDRDKTRLTIDQAIRQLEPQVDSIYHRTEFIPVKQQNGKESDYYVISIKISKSNQIYKLKNTNDAYIRREASIEKLTPEQIEQRILSNTIKVLIDKLRPEQRKIFDQIVNTLSETRITKSQVIIIKGHKGIGKSVLIDAVKQHILNDQRHYSTYNKAYEINIKDVKNDTSDNNIMMDFIDKYSLQNYYKSLNSTISIQQQYIDTFPSQDFILVLKNISSMQQFKNLIPQLKQCIVIVSCDLDDRWENVDLEFSRNNYKFHHYILLDQNARRVSQQVFGITEAQINILLQQNYSSVSKVIERCREVNQAQMSIYEYLGSGGHDGQQNQQMQSLQTRRLVHQRLKQLDELSLMMLMKLSLINYVTDEYINYVFDDKLYILQNLVNLQLVKEDGGKYEVPLQIKQQIARIRSPLSQNAIQSYMMYHRRKRNGDFQRPPIIDLMECNNQQNLSDTIKARKMINAYENEINKRNRNQEINQIKETNYYPIYKKRKQKLSYQICCSQ